MTTIEKKTTNELFRFVNLKQIGVDAIEEIDHHYIQHQFSDLTPAQLADLETTVQLFYSIYLSLVDSTNTVPNSNINDDIRNAAETYSWLFTDEATFTAKFPHLLRILRWIDNHRETITKEEFINIVESELGTSIQAFVTGSSGSGSQTSLLGGNSILPDISNNNFLVYWFRLWDNLIIHTCQIKNPSCIHLSSQAITLLALLKRIAFGDDSLNEEKEFLDALTAMPLLPLNSAQLLGIYNASGGSGNQTASSFSGSGQGSNEKTLSANRVASAKQDYGTYLSVLEEIKAVMKKKELETKSNRIANALNPNNTSTSSFIPNPENPTQPINDGEGGGSGGGGSTGGTTSGGTSPVYPPIFDDGSSDPVIVIGTYTLTEADMANLSPEAIAIIQQYAHGVSNITFQELLEIINGLISGAIKTIASGTPKVGTIRIGSVILKSDEYCTDMAEAYVTPCQQVEMRDFKSEGALANMATIGDLIVTKQQLIKYDLGEVAHVETIMQGEERKRNFVTTDRLEELTVIESETENETLTDTQTTERFSVEKESSKVLNSQMNINAGMNVSAEFGPVKMETSFDFSTSRGSTESNKDATNFSKDVTNRALKRVKEKVRTLRSKLQIHEVVDSTEHKYVNIPGTDHINGVYRWLDKYYLNKVLNYGKRLMMEFTVPEPASFYIFNKMLKAKGSNDFKTMPIDPNELNEVIKDSIDPTKTLATLKLNSFKDITKENYEYFASYYNLTDIEPYPAVDKIISAAYNVKVTGNADGGLKDDSLIVPDGYKAKSFKVAYELADDPNNESGLRIQVGTNVVRRKSKWTLNNETDVFNFNPFYIKSSKEEFLLHNEIKGNDKVPVSIKAWCSNGARTVDSIVNLQVFCDLDEAGIDKWRLKLYKTIMEKYQLDLRDYEEWLRAQEIYDLPDMGNNPDINRTIEQTELKRRCLEMFSGQRFESFDATVNGIPNVSSYPEFNFMEAIKEGSMARFFEQAYDWKNMTYEFYPYYYARKKMWLTLNNIQEKNDPVFESFLKAGYARVVVPVRPGYELLLALYAGWSWINKGQSIPVPLALLLYSGKGMPNVGIDHPLFVSVMNELSQIQTLSEDAPIEVGHYVQKVPTNLVYLAKQHLVAGESPQGDLPDHSSDPDIINYL